MRAYFPELAERLENECRTATGIRRWVAIVCLEGMRWSIRVYLFFVLLLCGIFAVGMAAGLLEAWPAAEPTLNAIAGLVIAGLASIPIIWCIRKTS